MRDPKDMSEPVNRLATPLPDSVLDRYYAENPDAVDHRTKVKPSDEVLTFDDVLDPVAGDALEP
jgi:hypothetical protein